MIKYRLATHEDNGQLIALTSSSGMPGKMSLRIDRNPDFFRINELRGETKVYVAVDGIKIVGSISVSDQTTFINKKILPLYYISDFKVAKAYRNQGIGLQLTNEVVKYLETQDADFAFLNVSKGNKRPFVFFKDRGHYPDFESIGSFTTFQYVGSKKYSNRTKYTITPEHPSEEIISFLNSYYSNKELSEVINADKLNGTELYAIRDQNQILAVMSIVDTMSMKQNVVLKMPWHLKTIISCFNIFSSWVNMSKLPKEHEGIKMIYIKYLALKQYDKRLIATFISFAKKIAYEKSYSFVSISVHENDILLKHLPKFLRFSFHSVGMLVSMKNSTKLMRIIKTGMPFRDYSAI